MTDNQKDLLMEIVREKRKRKPDKKLLKRLTNALCSEDDRDTRVRNDRGRCTNQRSPSFGIFKGD